MLWSGRLHRWRLLRCPCYAVSAAGWLSMACSTRACYKCHFTACWAALCPANRPTNLALLTRDAAPSILTPCTPAHTPLLPLTDGDGIAAALRAWGDLASTCRAVPAADRSGLRFATPLTLLHLIAGLGSRVQRLLPPGTASWRQLAESLAAACAISDSHRLQLRALCCWALQPAGKPAGATQAEQADRPVLVCGRPPLSAAFRDLAQKGHTPLLSVHLVCIPRGTSLPSMLAELLHLHERASGVPASGLLRHMHVLDALGFDPESEEVRGMS